MYTKNLANNYLEFARPVKISDFFNLTLTYNYGAAFSILSNDQTSWQMIMFSIISFIASLILTYMILRYNVNHKMELFGLSMILGGAVGNLYDRAFRGYVIDFLDFHIKNYHWPSFNIADTAITLGAIVLILMSMFNGSKS